MEIQIQYSITQIIDGVHYTGYLEVGDKWFDFEIRNLDKRKIRHKEQITIERNRKAIHLADNEFVLFAHLLGKLVKRIYFDERVRTINEIIPAISEQNCEGDIHFGVSFEIGLTAWFVCSLNPGDQRILESRKFGCRRKKKKSQE